MKKICCIILLLVSFYSQAQVSPGSQVAPPKHKMKPLFNGKNLNGWYSFLASKGKNNDPEKVFAIEDGLLHISGKEFGYICTENLYKNFHLVAEFKWGTKKFPPRDADTIRRDNGICYYIPADEKDKVWPRSIECQIQEGDVGDIWLIGGTTVVIDGERTVPKDYLRVQKKKDGEKPNGEWNRIDIIADKGNITYWVNGLVVNSATLPNITEGKILIQSEGAEIFYRTLQISRL